MRPKNIGQLLFGVWLVLLSLTFPGSPTEIRANAFQIGLGALLIASGVCTLLDI